MSAMEKLQRLVEGCFIIAGTAFLLWIMFPLGILGLLLSDSETARTRARTSRDAPGMEMTGSPQLPGSVAGEQIDRFSSDLSKPIVDSELKAGKGLASSADGSTESSGSDLGSFDWGFVKPGGATDKKEGTKKAADTAPVVDAGVTAKAGDAEKKGNEASLDGDKDDKDKNPFKKLVNILRFTNSYKKRDEGDSPAKPAVPKTATKSNTPVKSTIQTSAAKSDPKVTVKAT
eukprot:TRINITY_DN685_c0_g1_i2.p2 TRINITY_DN685_c0_g1~~TRINITY_DN685_c0_g1_i2.p2  ORF type:complete len:231 (+),score=47.96 TRINITY_DN685_c0_g1_i2:354-1046(+)